MIEILNILIWPIVLLVFAVIFVVLFKRDISHLLKNKLEKLTIPKWLEIIFSKQYQITKENDQNLFENLYLKMTGAQLRFLFVLRESMKNGGRGMDCGYVSNYFQNIIKSKTDRYDGWITPFITAYLQENGLVTVADNFFRINKIGNEFLDYIEAKKYKVSEKEL